MLFPVVPTAGHAVFTATCCLRCGLPACIIGRPYACACLCRCVHALLEELRVLLLEQRDQVGRQMFLCLP